MKTFLIIYGILSLVGLLTMVYAYFTAEECPEELNDLF